VRDITMRSAIVVYALSAIVLIGFPSMSRAQHEHHGSDHHHEPAGAADAAPSVTASVTPNASLRVGERVPLTLTLQYLDGKPVLLDELKVVHTQPIHVLVVDPSLTDYQHEHPEAGSEPGSYTFSITPKKSGEYKFFANIVLNEDEVEQYVPFTAVVEGTPSPQDRKVNITSTAHDNRFDLSFDQALASNTAILATVDITDSEGEPQEKLEPIMGTFAHIVAFSADRSEVVHIHPMGDEADDEDDRGGPSFEFHAEFPHAGYYKMFVQVRLDGQDVFVPFGLDVSDGPAKLAEGAKDR